MFRALGNYHDICPVVTTAKLPQPTVGQQKIITKTVSQFGIDVKNAKRERATRTRNAQRDRATRNARTRERANARTRNAQQTRNAQRATTRKTQNAQVKALSRLQLISWQEMAVRIHSQTCCWLLTCGCVCRCGCCGYCC